MTCKDCIHYDVCHNNFKNIDLNEEMTDEHRCVYFKDKSCFVELPCNDEIRFFINKGKIDVATVYSTTFRVNIDIQSDKSSGTVSFYSFNKNFYKDKSKAEAKLKELNEK